LEVQIILKDSPIKGKKIVPKTVKDEWSLLKSMFKNAVESGKLPGVSIRRKFFLISS